MLLLIPLLFGMAFSQEAEELTAIGILARFLTIILKVLSVGGSLSIAFWVILIIIGLVIFLILRNASYKFLQGAIGNEAQANAIATLISLAITILAFSQTNLVLAILAIAATPLSVYFLMALIFGAIGAFWVGWDRAWGAAAFSSMLCLFIIYHYGKVDVEALNSIAGTNLPPYEHYTPKRALDKVAPGLGLALDFLFFFGVIGSFGYAIVGMFRGGTS